MNAKKLMFGLCLLVVSGCHRQQVSPEAVPTATPSLFYDATDSWSKDHLASPNQVVITEKRIVVSPGNTLWALSRQVYGSSFYWPLISWFNQMTNPNLILPGQVLRYEVGYSAFTANAARDFAYKYHRPKTGSPAVP